jgi:hypothetical protein
MDGRVVFGAQEYSALAPTLPDILPEWSPLKHFGGYYGAKRASSLEAVPADHPSKSAA